MLRYEDPDDDMVSLNACSMRNSVDACALTNVLEENSAAVQAVVDVRSCTASSESGSRLQMELETSRLSAQIGGLTEFNREIEWYGPPCNRWVRTGPPSPGLASKLWNAIQEGSFRTLSLVEEVIADEFLWL